ncbi:MAG: rhomboid family intramembrane serine protease [Candidatus ainarchaeum sp.]|nr:rhomboid family intramembrane serine protease [Candidatus ainarchaeum sp.]
MIAFILLAVICITYILQLIFPSMLGIPLTELFYFDPSRAFSEPWLFITSIFLHGSFIHLFFNGYALFLFGSILEHKIKTKNFLILFFLAGLIGSIFYFSTILLNIAPAIPALGASGAIFGILGALAVLMPEMRIWLWFFPMRMKHAALLWIALELFGTFNTGSGIASAAHLGGLLFGVIFGFYLKNKDEIDITFYRNY